MSKHQCPACGAATRRVSATLARNALPMDSMPLHPPGAKQDFWTLRIPSIGFMAPEVCSECDLVSWYAYPQGKDLPALEQDEAAGLPVVTSPEPTGEVIPE